MHAFYFFTCTCVYVYHYIGALYWHADKENFWDSAYCYTQTHCGNPWKTVSSSTSVSGYCKTIQLLYQNVCIWIVTLLFYLNYSNVGTNSVCRGARQIVLSGFLLHTILMSHFTEEPFLEYPFLFFFMCPEEAQKFTFEPSLLSSELKSYFELWRWVGSFALVTMDISHGGHGFNSMSQ